MKSCTVLVAEKVGLIDSLTPCVDAAVGLCRSGRALEEKIGGGIGH